MGLLEGFIDSLPSFVVVVVLVVDFSINVGDLGFHVC